MLVFSRASLSREPLLPSGFSKPSPNPSKLPPFSCCISKPSVLQLLPPSTLSPSLAAGLLTMSAAFVSSLCLKDVSFAVAASPRSELLSRPALSGRLSPRLAFVDVSLTFSKTCLSSHSRKFPRNFALVARASDLTEEVEVDAGVDLNGDPILADEPDFGPITNMGNATEGNKLYVGNLPWSCNSEQLAEVFQEAGGVEMVEVIYDRESGRSRGFGFVTMSSEEDALSAISKLDGAEYGGRTLRVNFPERNRGDAPRPPRRDFEDGPSQNANKLFVGNLPWSLDDVSLEQMFSEHGKVIEAKVVYDRETGRSRGFGFVTLANSNEVNEAISSLDGAQVDGRTLRVNLAADRPPPRRDFF